jgi:glycerophosphoryl diester phosphodiesterase
MLAPLVISHAACKGHAPENTLAGIAAALKLGVDAIEIDVHRSRDGVPVLLHDRTLDRTTDGVGAVTEQTIEQIKRLDAGARSFDGRFSGEQIPTLAEALDLTRHACLLVIEIKQEGIEEEVASVVRRMEAAGASMIWSFHPESVRAARAAMPGVPAAQLWAGRSGSVAELFDGAVLRGAQAVSVHYSAVNQALVHAARLRGLSVYTWTADEAADQMHAILSGVAGICTNVPDVLRETFAANGISPLTSPAAAPGVG